MDRVFQQLLRVKFKNLTSQDSCLFTHIVDPDTMIHFILCADFYDKVSVLYPTYARIW